MLANVSLTLVNGDLSVGAPRPYLPNVIEVGGLHMKAPKQLPIVSPIIFQIIH